MQTGMPGPVQPGPALQALWPGRASPPARPPEGTGRMGYRVHLGHRHVTHDADTPTQMNMTSEFAGVLSSPKSRNNVTACSYSSQQQNRGCDPWEEKQDHNREPRYTTRRIYISKYLENLRV